MSAGGQYAQPTIDEPMSIHRRAILESGLAAIAAAGLPGFAPRAGTTRPTRRVIPSSGTSIPVVGLGTWITFNVGADPVLLDESVAVMAAFFEAGGTVIDSSPMYGSSRSSRRAANWSGCESGISSHSATDDRRHPILARNRKFESSSLQQRVHNFRFLFAPAANSFHPRIP